MLARRITLIFNHDRLSFAPSTRGSVYHNVGRRYIGMARMPVSRNTFSKPPNSQTKAFYIASCTPGPLL